MEPRRWDGGSIDAPADPVPTPDVVEELLDPVRLIIWDLDDTLWTGTLSEGAVTLDESRARMIRTLNRRGIVNSICSKNDRAGVRKQLESADLWEEFILARIEWAPKGTAVAQIIDDAQLRPENVLFIDDLALNREEVRHVVPDIQTAGPEIIDRLLSLPQLVGKDDSDLSRLRQYKVLEQKLTDRQATVGNNEDFLRSCDICVGIFTDTAGAVERLFELAHRTNQLNFTKRRLDRDSFAAMLTSRTVESGYLRVRDRYGDYGICGFYSITAGVLTDFLFSCRILHMGVEQWLYDHLGRPPLAIVGEVASSLEGSVGWIALDTEWPDGNRSPSSSVTAGRTEDGSTSHQVLMVGGCDLIAVTDFIGGDVMTDFSRTGQSGHFIHIEHSELLRQSFFGVTSEEELIIDRIPFLDRPTFRSPAVIAPAYDVLVYSVLMDYTQGLYRHRRLGLIVPYGQFNQDATDPTTWPAILRKSERVGIDRDFLTWFAEEFEFLGYISVEQFCENIRWLAGAIPPGAQLILLNGAEVPVQLPEEPDRHIHHHQMNLALDALVAQLPNAVVCDVRGIVTSEDDLRLNIRHYQRRCYLQIAHSIRAVGVAGMTVRRDHWTTVAAMRARRLVGHARKRTKRFYRRRRRQVRALRMRRGQKTAGQSV